ncbi:putative cobaltochelatase [Pseudonocardia abyssalis]|uniref:Mg-protoporphyrin IX chelatase n=1 Tax=Pseudonocardia abyssalis TaxID=2792008 RepID=A0ABS6USR5_9PSEU|nr:putative cobaltochelatase [Pseudonocardia abyssalis]MBW0118282.1 putative cobaltochelatase [Pseudonocardia abyssalis]MBW0135255.1 putative cobaltochelatase [Pseudonocardia abyssalis]
MTSPQFPFSAVVGHDDLRLALLLNAVHPGVGGVLVRGEKGTAKSTAVRALAALLPALQVVPGCRFGCDPTAPDPACPDGPHAATVGESRAARLVELPVGATDDRLVGSLDLERALSEGVRAYQPGLLADAHRGVLYVDEVNLLHDHLVDLLLDAAAMGRAHVERDGVSVSHAARFLLVGTMNPEEGELRPQLLDRFGLAVEVRAARDVGTRVEVVRRRMAFDDDPAGFTDAWRAADAEVAARIVAARSRVAAVVLPDAELRRIASVCAAFDVDGMRADLVIARAAVAHAAWRGVGAVEEEDVRVAARLALPHRRRRDPFDEPGMDEGALDDALRDAAEQKGADGDGPDDDGPDGGPGGGPGGVGPDRSPDHGGPDHGGPDDGGPDDGGPETRDPDAAGPDGGGDLASDRPDGAPDPDGGPTQDGPQPQGSPTGRADGPSDREGVRAPAPTDTFRARRLEVPGLGEGAPGRRSRARTDSGRVVRAVATTPRRAADVHLPASITAAAPHQRSRGRTGPALVLRHGDLRSGEREGREGNLVLFAVDASGSMAARARMSAVSGAVLSLLRDAYQRRDKVGLVTFRAGGAELVLPPTSSVPAAQARMASMRTGGRTPLADGLLRAREVLRVERLRDPRRRALLVLLTDGRATVGRSGEPVSDACRAAALLAADGVATVVVDCESGPVRLGLAARIAAAAGGEIVTIGALSADGVTGVVHAARAA